MYYFHIWKDISSLVDIVEGQIYIIKLLFLNRSEKSPYHVADVMT